MGSFRIAVAPGGGEDTREVPRAPAGRGPEQESRTKSKYAGARGSVAPSSDFGIPHLFSHYLMIDLLIQNCGKHAFTLTTLP